MNFIPHVDRLLNNILPNLDQMSDIGMVVVGLLYQLKVQNKIYQEDAIAFQRLESEAQELRSMVKKYRQLNNRLGKLNDQLRDNNIHLSEDNSRLRDENLRLLDDNYELSQEIVRLHEGKGSH